MPALSLLSDTPLVPKDPAPPPRADRVKVVAVCPLCHLRQPEAHPCTAIGRSDVFLAVGYADSSMTLVEDE
jgi:hypothetical protein